MPFRFVIGDVLRQAIAAMQAAGDADPKLLVIMEQLRDRQWVRHGCILFSQYFDSVWWLAGQLRQHFGDEPIGVYGGGTKCNLPLGNEEEVATRDELKKMVQERQLRLMIATDAASEGLNLQQLETLINLRLPWSPARLEQRNGRINRIGQIAEVVCLLNLRYRGSVENKVHEMLSDRL
jgi:ERCC4-related helicase